MVSVRTITWAVLAAGLAEAAGNIPYNFEVKLLMDPTKVLGSDNKLTPSVLSTFSMPTSVTKMNVQFLDNDNKDIYSATWSPRIRKIEGQSDFELTYKKRYPISNDNPDAAATQANNDGFDTSVNYDSQDEYGWQQQTLSLSNQQSASSKGYSGMDLPSTSDSRTMLINNAPGKFNNWNGNNWGTNILASSRIYGPVLAKRSIGTYNGTQFYIEVWPIKAASGSGTEYIVEASLKVNDKPSAKGNHDGLATLLQSKGWFLAQDSLKTSLIMQRY